MNAVFADTFFFLALVNRKDKAHRRAVEFSAISNRPMITTTWILMEVGDALWRGSDRAAFLHLLDNLANDPDATVVPATHDLFEKAKSLFAARPDKDWSMTDCTSFIVMQERGITEAITGDRDFEQAGFVRLLNS